MNKKNQPKTIYLKDYKEPPFSIETVVLDVLLGEEVTKVKSILNVNKKKGSDAPLVLDGSEFLDLKSITLNGQDLAPKDYLLTDKDLTIYKVPEQFILETMVEIKPQKNTTLNGLYKSQGMFCTQCEAEGFRNITYYLDRPDIMAKFKCRIEGDKEKYPVLLSNGNLVSEGQEIRGRHFAIWEDPFPKPSYLFALVAGDLSFIENQFETKSGLNVALRIYTRPDDIGKCEFAMESLINSMKWDEEVYGLEYDLAIYNIVAVSDFNMGAMENKGLNIFNTKYVLANEQTGTDTDFDGIEGVIGHEYFHNWTGNRVTCRDWFQLSLKEGLTVFRDQEFSSDMGSRAQKRIDDVQALRGHQFPEDDGPMAHPIRPESFVEINNFYTATVYNKGAEVIRMMHGIIGSDAFRQGMDLYFERHDGQAVTCEDFILAMEDASGVDLGQFRLWYSQAGTPEIEVHEKFYEDTQSYELEITQTIPTTPNQLHKKPMYIPIRLGLLDEKGRLISPEVEGDVIGQENEFILNLKTAKQSFKFKGLKEKPTPSLLRGFSAPVKLNSNQNNGDLAFLMAHDTDAFVKWEAGQKLSENIIFGVLDDIKKSKEQNILDAFFDGFEGLLKNDRQDKALVAEALKLPSEIYLGQSMEILEVDGLHKARALVREKLATRFYTHWLEVYFSNTTKHAYRFTQEDKAKRKLKNTALGYLMFSGKEEATDICYGQFKKADNMTDCIAALGSLVNSNSDKKEIAVSEFYNKWENDDLVIDKWFSLQAMSESPNTIESVIALSEHPDFNLKNPNRLRSLINVFSLLNQVRFHDPKGRGYKFLADIILKLDGVNPQVAARMMPPLSRWKKLDNGRQTLIKKQLERIGAKDNLSKDVREIVSKSL